MTTTTVSQTPDPATQPSFYDGVVMKRVFAFVIDTILIGIVTMLLIPLTGFTALLFIFFFASVVAFFYRVISISRKSATPGMRLMAIELRNHQGEMLSTGTAFAHTILFMISMSMAVPQLVSFAMMILTPRRQSLYDMLLGTVVVNKSARV